MDPNELKDLMEKVLEALKMSLDPSQIQQIIDDAYKKYDIDNNKLLDYLEVYPLIRRLIFKLAGLTEEEMDKKEKELDKDRVKTEELKAEEKPKVEKEKTPSVPPKKTDDRPPRTFKE